MLRIGMDVSIMSCTHAKQVFVFGCQLIIVIIFVMIIQNIFYTVFIHDDISYMQKYSLWLASYVCMQT